MVRAVGSHLNEVFRHQGKPGGAVLEREHKAFGLLRGDLDRENRLRRLRRRLALLAGNRRADYHRSFLSCFGSNVSADGQDAEALEGEAGGTDRLLRFLAGRSFRLQTRNCARNQGRVELDLEGDNDVDAVKI